jgi:hypothetical protein
MPCPLLALPLSGDALRSFCSLAKQTTSGPDFRRAMSKNGIDVDPEAGNWEELHQLYRRFATEFLFRMS